MLSKQNVLPNFFKLLILTTVSTFSLSSFADELKTESLTDISVEVATVQSDELLIALPESVEQTSQEVLDDVEMDKELEKVSP